MDLTRPFSFLAFSFPAFFFLARLFQLLPRLPSIRPAAPDADASAPAGLHHDLGLPPAEDVPPDAQALRHHLLSRTGLW